MQNSPPAPTGFMQFVNVPNAISVTRLLTAPGVVVLASQGWSMAFLALSLVLLMTDWVDGRIARAWNQQTTFGARLDAFSDVAIYACIAWGVYLLERDIFWGERYWLATLLGTYVLSMAVCFGKFGCLPNYHTRMSKISWFLVTVGVAALILDISMWPLRLAFVTVILANLESIAMTFLLREWRSDIPTLAHAVQESKPN
jgi:CDP-diacylglycerol--glycerol-3-phosphate 3-phosphatidyltransferase